jgi:type I restriction enzyme M protein
MPKRRVRPEDYIARRALYLPESARYDVIMQRASSDPGGLPALVTQAMTDIETEFEPLAGVLPKDYGIFEPKVLEDLMRLFNGEQIRTATGDVFGRIYEYFLAEFSMQKAHDNGEFFTPSSIVQTIVNVIEPDHGTVFDPASGSGGMFVQSSHFIEHEGGDTAKKVVFYGQEKNRDTIRIAQMNLAVHGLEGNIAEAITYYQDEHTLTGKCDFVMANPPFNVDLVDAERIKKDPRLPFGLPGVNKNKKVPNGNYLWISYFWSYLGEGGRAGFVMSSQASSAGHGEKEVRRKIVETGDVDVMISIRSGFFYTRSVPCELWFFDRGKPKARRDKVLMIDARNVFRKVTRKINDFSPEQMANLSAIVWLYRGQRDRFLALVKQYLGRVCEEIAAIPAELGAFETTLISLRERIDASVAVSLRETKSPHAEREDYTIMAANGDDAEKLKMLVEATAELKDAVGPYEMHRARLLADMDGFRKNICKSLPATNDKQHAARKMFDPIAERIKGLIKQIDLLYKIAARANAASVAVSLCETKEPHAEREDYTYDRRASGRLVKQLDEERKAAVEQLKHATYFHRQIVWLQGRFPNAELAAVPGLVKLVDRGEIEAADWSLTPGRYVGVAPAEEDEDFDYEQTLRDIHVELTDLNNEAIELAAKIQTNFQELGI